MELKIGISGKRMLSALEQPRVYRETEAYIRNVLRENGVSAFTGYTALASGADMIFADVVTQRFGMPLQVVLPMPLEDYAGDFVGEDALKLAGYMDRFGAKAIRLTALSPADDTARNELYIQAGKYIVDQCKEMIFVWDELPPRGRGGTAEILGYYSQLRDVVPVKYIAVAPEPGDPLYEALTAAFDKSNKTALENRNNYRSIWKNTLLLGLFAALLFAIGVGFIPGEKYPFLKLLGSALELLLVSIVFVLITRAKRKKYHWHYLHARLQTEKLRIIKCCYQAGIPVKRTDSDSAGSKAIRVSAVLEDKVEAYDRDPIWYGNSEITQYIGKVNEAVSGATYYSKWYSNYCIRQLIAEQQGYHTGRKRKSSRDHEFWELLIRLIPFLFLAALAGHLVVAVCEYYKLHVSLLHHMTTFAIIFLPALYAAIEGRLYFETWDPLKKQSEQVGARLEIIKTEMQEHPAYATDAGDLSLQELTMNLVADVMLADNHNWHIVLEGKDNYHSVL